MRDTGVLNKMKYDALNPPVAVPLPKVWKDEPLNLSQLGIIMMVFVGGVLSSIIAFVLELRKTILHKFNRSQPSIGIEKAWIKENLTRKKRDQGVKHTEIAGEGGPKLQRE